MTSVVERAQVLPTHIAVAIVLLAVRGRYVPPSAGEDMHVRPMPDRQVWPMPAMFHVWQRVGGSAQGAGTPQIHCGSTVSCQDDDPLTFLGGR